LRFGVPVVIGIDPLGQIITIYRSDELPRMLGIDDTLTLPDVLPGFSVPVRYLFE